MRTKGTREMGRASVEMEVTNNDDLALLRRGLLRRDQVRRATVSGVVDSGAAMLVLPQSLVRQLGVSLRREVKVRSADGRRGKRKETDGVQVQILGRDATFNAVVEPKRDTALIGKIVMGALDLLVDCKEQRLVPRDPSGPVYELE